MVSINILSFTRFLRRIARACILLIFLTCTCFEDLAAQNPNWVTPVGSNFQFSANVIAVLHLSDTTSNDANDVIAYFDGDSIRGKGNAISLGNGDFLHFITVFSNNALDTFTVKVYHNGTDYVYDVQQPYIFRSQSIEGSIDTPTVINIYPDNIAPFYLLPVSPQKQLQGYAFDSIDMKNYLVNPNGLAIEWSYIPNPNLIVSFVGSVLSVSGVNGFTGQAPLTIRVSRPSLASHKKKFEVQDRSGPIPPAETTILFDVTPTYLAPLWQPDIPGQGIIVGSQFDPIALNEYENQFAGPAILYDYVPLIEETVPNVTRPSWQVLQNYRTTMTVIARLDYTPKYHFYHEDDVLAAMVNNEIRGVAVRDSQNGLFYLTIGGEQYMGDKVKLMLYSGAMKEILTVDSAFAYKPYQILGNDITPKIIEFAPIVPIVPQNAVQNGMYTMPVNVVNQTFIGSVTFAFFALDPTFPQLLNDTTITTFCVASDSSQLIKYYADEDGDGLGNPFSSIYSCTQPSGYVTNGNDCRDNLSGTTSITISALENSGIPNDGVICASTTVILSVDQLATSYLWSSGQTTKTITINPNSSTSYSVSVTYNVTCVDEISNTVKVETKIVKNSSNNGFNSLRSVFGCLNENDTITYELPMVQTSLLTESLIIDKNVTILGSISVRPIVSVNFLSTLNGLVIRPSKKLTLNNVDLKEIGLPNQPIISGPGTLEITGVTKITSQ